MTLPKIYTAKDYEDDIYTLWEDSGKFNPDNLPADEPFTIILPPPNATGTLHLGHAMYLVQDIMIRYQRMLGKKTLWLPGTDHAAIATQNRVEKNLAKRTPPVTRQQLGRDKFVQEIERFVDTSRSTIRNQLRKMGFSLDWSREAFTLDAPRQAAVSQLFIRMYNDGLIYRGHRIVNWCPRCQSTLADDEVEYQEQPTKFYYFKYGPVVIATARPETKFLDKTIVVHPDDERYTRIHGKTLTVDWIDGSVTANVIADPIVDRTFGTGAMTITPAHSQEDFRLAQKYNLSIVQIIDEQGNFTSAAGAFAGKNARASRDAIVAILEQKGLVDHIDDNYVHNLSVCYRCGTAIEPLTKLQWFVNVDQALPLGHVFAGKTLKQVANEVVTNGQIEIIPDRFNSTYFHWMNNLHDWCISRQLWYGHRIPAWYQGDEIEVQVDSPGPDWIQDEDVLDTWFSSGMWTFSALGWPTHNNDVKTFHPTQVLETGYDILFFWVARMILLTTYALGEVPFTHVYLHGLVRDKQGRKMSKSLGNGIDPLDMIAQYGTDALRLALIAGTTPGNDSRLYPEKIAGFRNFINKIWNIARYVMTLPPRSPSYGVGLADRWIQSRLVHVLEDVDHDFATYQFGAAVERLYDFLWHDFADWYVEITKFAPNPSLTKQVLEVMLKTLHPFVPFVTEVLWQQLYPGTLLMTEPWPKAHGTDRDAAVEKRFADLRAIITFIRNLRTQYRIDYARPIPVRFVAVTALLGEVEKSITTDVASEQQMVERLARVQIQDQLPVGVTTEFTNASYTVSVALGDVIDVAAERLRLQKNIDKVTDYLGRLKAKLSNPDYVSQAPAEVVERDRATITEQNQLLETLQKSYQSITVTRSTSATEVAPSKAFSKPS